MSLDRRQIIDSALSETSSHQEDEARRIDEELQRATRSFVEAWRFIAETPAAKSALTDLFELIRPETNDFNFESLGHLAYTNGCRNVWLHIQHRLLESNLDIHQIVRGR